MWFVIHVKPGTEARAVGLLKSTDKSDGLEEVFCPMAECVRQERGEFVESNEPMLEGCVFAVAPSKRELRACMRRADGLDELIEVRPSFEALEDGEALFIDLLASRDERTVQMSEGVIDHGKIVVESGPLRGFDQRIRKYSRRRRWAYLDTSVAGEPASARVGLRVTRSDKAPARER